MSLEAEQAIIASMMENDTAYDAAVEKLSVMDFTDDRMRLLFEGITKLKGSGKTTDVITLSNLLSKSQRWISTGIDDPVAYLSMLLDSAHSFVAVKQYIDIVKTASTVQLLIEYCAEVYTLTKDSDLSGEDMIAKAHKLLPTIETGEGVATYSMAAKRAVEALNKRFEGELMGVTTGLDHLDKLILGWEPGTLNILAGRPSHGKSIYAMDFAHAAAKTGPVFVFSLEMTTENVALRGMASLGGANFGKLRSGKLVEQDWPLVTSAVVAMQKLPIYIDDRGGIGVDQLCARARAMARRDKPVLIVVDYLQLLAGKGDNRTAQIGNVSRSLKALAKGIECSSAGPVTVEPRSRLKT